MIDFTVYKKPGVRAKYTRIPIQYLDTFRYFYPKKKIFNSEVIVGNNNYHVLEGREGELPMMVSTQILLDKKSADISPIQLINNITIWF